MKENDPSQPSPLPSEANLSAREYQIGLQLIEGRSNSEIARELGISPLTVKKHLENLMKKIGARNRLVAAIHFYKLSRRGGPKK
jgi:DNA-binding CsgD family transcriptional regulator